LNTASTDQARGGARLEPGNDGLYRIVGDLGLESAAALLGAGEAAFAGQPSIEVDLSGVTDADSAGLAVLIEWTRSARRGGRSIVFSGMTPRLAAIARIGGVGGLLPTTR